VSSALFKDEILSFAPRMIEISSSDPKAGGSINAPEKSSDATDEASLNFIALVFIPLPPLGIVRKEGTIRRLQTIQVAARPTIIIRIDLILFVLTISNLK
tara:strand:- start:333 stop:632 length:300 start_codon:yes stop_codon:yes gene_type:complete